MYTFRSHRCIVWLFVVRILTEFFRPTIAEHSSKWVVHTDVKVKAFQKEKDVMQTTYRKQLMLIQNVCMFSYDSIKFRDAVFEI